MDLNELIRKANDEPVDIDFLRDGIAMLAQALMEVDVTNRIGAAMGERAPEARTTQRNGYRARRWDTRAGTVELWRSPSCARAATSPTSCSSRVGGPSVRWPAR